MPRPTTAVNESFPPSPSPTARGLARAAWLLVVLLAALGGFASGRLSGRHSAAAPAVEVRSETQWLAAIASLDVMQLGPGEREELLRALVTSAEVRRAVFARYLDHGDSQAAVVWRQLLTARAAPDVLEAALETAETARGGQRARAVELLSWLPPDVRSFELAYKLARSEKDESIVVAALMALGPPEVPSAAESQKMVAWLDTFARHPAPRARAHAVQRLAEWDKTQTVSSARALEGLSDEAAVVRTAAVGAVMLGQLRSEPLKSALLRVLADPREEMTTRAAALQALEAFALDEEEHAAYVAARQELERLAAAEMEAHSRPD
jgi:hypothetical protein